MTLITDEMLRDLALLYNKKGKRNFYKMIREEYGVKNPYGILRRMKNQTDFEYIDEEDRFQTETQKADSSGVFLSMDELCTPPQTHDPHQGEKSHYKSDAMEKLIHDLIGDRLLEISRYVTLDALTKTIMIDKTSLTVDGYHIVTH